METGSFKSIFFENSDKKVKPVFQLRLKISLSRLNKVIKENSLKIYTYFILILKLWLWKLSSNRFQSRVIFLSQFFFRNLIYKQFSVLEVDWFRLKYYYSTQSFFKVLIEVGFKKFDSKKKSNKQLFYYLHSVITVITFLYLILKEILTQNSDF